MIMPSLSRLRNLGRVLSADNRVHLARHELAPVLENFKTGFSLARDTGAGPLLIAALVNVAIASQQLKDVQYLIQEPNAPNLYWALSALPRPFVGNIADIMLGEKSGVYFSLPKLEELENRIFSPAEIREKLQAAWDILEIDRHGLEEAFVVGSLVSAYPQAKAALLKSGMDPARVEAMPALQAVFIWWLRDFTREYDNALKLFLLPYPAARAAFERMDARFDQIRKLYPSNPLMMLVPALSRAYFIFVRLDRQIAALQVIEALRMYAAGHDGKLPGSLDEVTEVPIPLDPLTGQAFPYRLEGGTAVIDWPAGFPPKEGEKYEITIK